MAINGSILFAMTSPLTPQEEAFAIAYADPTCKGATDAYAKAGYSTKGVANTIHRQAFAILNRPKVAARIEELRKRVEDDAVFKAADVLREWMLVATADPAEISQVRRFCCRHCYGIDHRYQWVSDEEFGLALARAIDFNANKTARQHSKPLPDYDGGVGYDRDLEPVPSCPHCGGDGYEETYFADTRRLSPGARKLFLGVERTQNGMKVRTRDPDAALLNIAKYLGMMAERHMHGGDPSNPTPIGTVAFTADMDPTQASKVYQTIMGGLAK